MNRRNWIIVGVMLAVTWIAVFSIVLLVINNNDDFDVEVVGTATPTQRPIRTDVAEIIADVPSPTPITIDELIATATARFTLSPVEVGIQDILPTAPPNVVRQPVPPGGAYPISLAVPELGILAAVLVVQTDGNFDIVTPQDEVAYYALTPKIGAGGNSVMVGHVYPGRVFNELLEIQIGQVIRITDEFYNHHYYLVQEISKFRYESGDPEEREIGLEYMYNNEEERITLVTCYPEYEWTHRFVVRAVPIPAPPDAGR